MHTPLPPRLNGIVALYHKANQDTPRVLRIHEKLANWQWDRVAIEDLGDAPVAWVPVGQLQHALFVSIVTCAVTCVAAAAVAKASWDSYSVSRPWMETK